jgi:hypothetical protein
MPPALRNHRDPTGADTPQASAASSLDNPPAIFVQNRRSSSRRTGGRPGDRIGGLPVAAAAQPGGRPIHTSVLEVLRRPVESAQYLAIRYTQRLADAGAVTSVGSRGDSFDNALAETTIGLYKTELIRRRGPWRGLDDVELAPLEWVDWYNHRRLHGACDHVPPAEYETTYTPDPTPAPEPSSV